MRKDKMTHRIAGLAAPLAASLVLAATAAQGDAIERCWSAADNQGWVNSYGECWKSIFGPADIPPCSVIIESLTIDLVNDEFAFDRAELTPDMEVALDDVVRRVEESSGDEALTIVGHTDGIGSQDYNLGLGLRRADSVADYLISRGIPADRLDTETMGKVEPVATNETDEGRAKNRRVEIRTSVYQG